MTAQTAARGGFLMDGGMAVVKNMKYCLEELGLNEGMLNTKKSETHKSSDEVKKITF